MVAPIPAPSPRGRRIVQPENADERLRDFGMDCDIIRRSIETGDSARRRVMRPAYPAIFPGVTMWAETLAGWRRQMLKRREEYEIGKTLGYETLYCVKRGVAFAVVAGDSYTGLDKGRDPRLVREKGPATTRRVARNRNASAVDGAEGVQGVLIPLPEIELPPDEKCETWLLIVHPAKNEIQIELSRPILMDGGIVCGYSERILLPPVKIEGGIAPLTPGDGEDDGGDDGDTLVH